MNPKYYTQDELDLMHPIEMEWLKGSTAREPRNQEGLQQISKAKKDSADPNFPSSVLVLQKETKGLQEREFFRFSHGHIDIYDRIGRGAGQIKLTEEENDLLKLMENPPRDLGVLEPDELSLLQTLGVKLYQRNYKKKDGARHQ